MSAIDPWELLQQQNAMKAKRAAAEDAEQERRRLWKKQWETALSAFDASAFRKLAAYLKPLQVGFWCDLQDLSLARLAWVLEQQLWPGSDLPPGYAYQVIGVALLKRALLNDQAGVKRELKSIEKMDRRAAFVSTLYDFRSSLENWLAAQPLPTPFLSQTELAKALRRKVEGFGNKSAITTKVQSGELQVNDRTKPARDGKTCYATIQHRDAKTQHEILRHVVAWMRETSPVGSSFSSGLWTSENT